MVNIIFTLKKELQRVKLVSPIEALNLEVRGCQGRSTFFLAFGLVFQGKCPSMTLKNELVFLTD